jgi:hypothetical protein
MESFLWIILSGIIAILLIIFLIRIFRDSKKGKKHTADYYSMFIIGIIFTGAGVSLGTTTGNYGMMILGFIFMAVGILNKDKWKEKPKTWKEMNSKQKKVKLWMLVLLGILVLLTFVFMILR